MSRGPRHCYCCGAEYGHGCVLGPTCECLNTPNCDDCGYCKKHCQCMKGEGWEMMRAKFILKLKALRDKGCRTPQFIECCRQFGVEIPEETRL